MPKLTTPPYDFATLLELCHEVAGWFPSGLVFIGGIAVYLHAVNGPSTQSLAATTHDADFYLSLAEMGDLRDMEEVTPNRRLSKHQMVRRGFEFDIYTERQSSLAVPYDAVVAHAVVFNDMRVAALEELLVLKLRAYKDRFGTAKGDKDARDLMLIAAVGTANGIEAERIAQYLDDDDLVLLHRVSTGSAAVALAAGNVQQAKKLRQYMHALSLAIAKAHGMEQPLNTDAIRMRKSGPTP